MRMVKCWEWDSGDDMLTDRFIIGTVVILIDCIVNRRKRGWEICAYMCAFYRSTSYVIYFLPHNIFRSVITHKLGPFDINWPLWLVDFPLPLTWTLACLPFYRIALITCIPIFLNYSHFNFHRDSTVYPPSISWSSFPWLSTTMSSAAPPPLQTNSHTFSFGLAYFQYIDQ